jgi:hypothetical protein
VLCVLSEARRGSSILIEPVQLEINRTFRGCNILLQKDAWNRNWYIIVTGKDGCYRYDGYWRDSEDRDWHEALVEAKKGACL